MRRPGFVHLRAYGVEHIDGQHIYLRARPIMTRPIDETWSCDGGCIDMDAPSVVHRIGSFGQSSAVQAETDRNEARARLAAQAPMLARLLRGMLAYRECEFCSQKVDRTVDDGNGGWLSTPEQHTPTCELIAVLRAAGVVE